MQKLIQKLFMLTLFGVILTALSSCESIRLAGAGSWSPGKNYHVTLGRSWSVLSERTDKGAPLKILTIDGPGLNMLIVLDGIKAGDSLFDQVRRDQPVPRFEANMSDSELVALVEDSMARVGLKQVHASNIRPHPFGSHHGVRFHLTGITLDGLNMRGDSLFAVYEDRFHLITFIAPDEHYFDALSGEVNNILRSVRQTNRESS